MNVKRDALRQAQDSTQGVRCQECGPESRSSGV